MFIYFLRDGSSVLPWVTDVVVVVVVTAVVVVVVVVVTVVVAVVIVVFVAAAAVVVVVAVVDMPVVAVVVAVVDKTDEGDLINVAFLLVLSPTEVKTTGTIIPTLIKTKMIPTIPMILPRKLKPSANSSDKI